MSAHECHSTSKQRKQQSRKETKNNKQVSGERCVDHIATNDYFPSGCSGSGSSAMASIPVAMPATPMSSREAEDVKAKDAYDALGSCELSFPLLRFSFFCNFFTIRDVCGASL